MNRLLLYTQQKRNGKIPLLISPRLGASENKSTLATYATEEKLPNFTNHLHAGCFIK
ncbi:MAG: hypothetical protein QNJ74_20420 [Trichodesmium sp. MO_231.B1]|nr:hypothetical protein [Trichodesmium sp. MO_231.B1]